MKIIFLDIDGVLATSQCWNLKKDLIYNAYPFDKGAVNILNQILEVEPELQIILSSDWRIEYSLIELDQIFKINNVNKSPVGFTTYIPPGQMVTGPMLAEIRAEEIQRWLMEHDKRDLLKWVAVDDLDMGEFLGKHFVRCPRQTEGMKQNGIKQKILKVLSC